MTSIDNIDLPRCEVASENPSRLQFARSLKDGYMRIAGRLASLRMGRRPRPQKDRFGILVYHRVSPNVPGLAAPYYNVPPEIFRQQLSGLQQLGFTFLALRDVLQRRARRESLPPLTVVVTFDDGFRSVVQQAFPALQELGIPATVFVSTAYVGQSEPFPFDAWGQAYTGIAPADSYLPMGFEECAKLMSSQLVEIGAHTHSHADFRGRPAVFRRDMEACLATLSEKLNVTCPTFAFPYGCPRLGHAGDDLVEEVRRLGLPTALTTVARCADVTDSPLRWGRFNAYDWDTADTLAAKLTGNYSWAPEIAERVSHLWQIRPRLRRRPLSCTEAHAHV